VGLGAFGAEGLNFDVDAFGEGTVYLDAGFVAGFADLGINKLDFDLVGGLTVDGKQTSDGTLDGANYKVVAIIDEQDAKSFNWLLGASKNTNIDPSDEELDLGDVQQFFSNLANIGVHELRITDDRSASEFDANDGKLNANEFESIALAAGYEPVSSGDGYLKIEVKPIGQEDDKV